MKSRKVGRYGIKIESSSSSPIARFANFNNLMEIVREFPDRIPPEVVIEYSEIANKEGIIDKIIPLPDNNILTDRTKKVTDDVKNTS